MSRDRNSNNWKQFLFCQGNCRIRVQNPTGDTKGSRERHRPSQHAFGYADQFPCRVSGYHGESIVPFLPGDHVTDATIGAGGERQYCRSTLYRDHFLLGNPGRFYAEPYGMCAVRIHLPDAQDNVVSLALFDMHQHERIGFVLGEDLRRRPLQVLREIRREVDLDSVQCLLNVLEGAVFPDTFRLNDGGNPIQQGQDQNRNGQRQYEQTEHLDMS